MLQIEPGNPRDKDTSGTFLMPKAPKTVVASPVIFMSSIVSNDRREVAHCKYVVCHKPILPAAPVYASEKRLRIRNE